MAQPMLGSFVLTTNFLALKKKHLYYQLVSEDRKLQTYMYFTNASSSARLAKCRVRP